MNGTENYRGKEREQMTTDYKECRWFLECHEEAIAQIEHPVLGWVDICGKHCDWLLEDDTPNPTKFVPPLAAKHGERLRSILAGLEDDTEEEEGV